MISTGRVLMALLASVFVGASCSSENSAGRLTLTVDPRHPGAVLPEDFVGLSFEASVLGSNLLDPTQSNLASLLADIGVGRLRFGGNSLDRVTAWVQDPHTPLPPWAHARVTPEDLRRLGALSAATGWRIDLGLAIGHAGPAEAAGEAAAAARLIGAGLASVAIGNEPDLLGHDHELRPDGYTYAQYRADVDVYRAAIRAAAPTVKLSGPDTAGLDWLAPFLADEHAGLALVTQHFYPLTRCGDAHPTIANLESAGTVASEQRLTQAAAKAAHLLGLPVRIDETNSASCGGQDGVSNTLAAALWMVDYLLLAAQNGVAGVDVHGGLAACRGYTPLCLPGVAGPTPELSPGLDPVADASLGAGAATHGRLAAQPDFYALLLVHLLEGSRRLPVSGDRSTPVDAFAFQMPDGSIRVVVDNPDPRFAGHIVLRVDGQAGTAGVLRLTGPSLASTSGVRFGGSSVAPDGTWHAVAGPGVAVIDGAVRLEVGPGSAALVTLPG